MKEFDQRVKPLKDKNRKFLEKNVELTTLNRNLKDQIRTISDENKKLVSIYRTLDKSAYENLIFLFL